MELVKLIWKTVLLILLLSLKFVLVQEFYAPEQAYLQQKSIESKIRYGGQITDGLIKFDDIKERRHMIDWLINVFPNIFDEIVLGKSERMSLYTNNLPNPIINRVDFSPIINH